MTWKVWHWHRKMARPGEWLPLISMRWARCWVWEGESTVSSHPSQIAICKFACSLKCVCIPKSHTQGGFADIHRHTQSSKIFYYPTCMFPAEMKQSNTLSYCLSSQTIHKWPGNLLSRATFLSLLLNFCAFCGLFLCLKWPLCVAEVVPSVSKLRKAVGHLLDKICVFDKFCFNMSYSAVCWVWI